MSWWNSRDVKPPPVSSTLYRTSDIEIGLLQEVHLILKDVSNTSISKLHLERGILKAFIKKHNAQLRHFKAFQSLKQVARCLELNTVIKVKQNLAELTDLIPRLAVSVEVRLPSRPVIEFSLIQLMACAAVLSQTANYCVYAYRIAEDELSLGQLLSQMTVTVAILSRVWVLVCGLVPKIAGWYKQLYKLYGLLSPGSISLVPEGECLPQDLKTWLEDSKLACTNTPNMESVPTHGDLAVNSLLDKLSKVTNKSSEDGDQLQVDGEGPDENMDKDLGCDAKSTDVISTDPNSFSAAHEQNTNCVTAMEVCEFVDFGSKVERQNVHSSEKIEKKTKVDKKKSQIEVDEEENETEVDEGQGHISVVALCRNLIEVTTTFKQFMEVINKINLMYSICAGCKFQSLETCLAEVKRLHTISEGSLNKSEKLKILNVMKKKTIDEHEKFWGSISAWVTEYCHNKFANLCQIQKLNDLAKQKKWTIDCGGVTILVKKKTRVKIGVLCVEVMKGGKRKKENRQAWRREVSSLLLLQLDRSLRGWDMKTSHCSDQELSMVPEGECLPRDLQAWLEDSELACTNTPNMESVPTHCDFAVNSLLDKLSKVTNKNSEDGDQLQVDGEGPDENMDKDLGCDAKRTDVISTDPSSYSAAHEHNTNTVTAMEVCESVDIGSKVERQNVHSSDKIEKKTKVDKKKSQIEVDEEENETEVDEGQGHIYVLTLCQNLIQVTTTFKQFMEVINKINLMYSICAGCKFQSLETCLAEVKRLHKISEGSLNKSERWKILNVMKKKTIDEHEKFWGSISAWVTEYCHNKFANFWQIQKLNDLVKQKNWTIDCDGVTILVKKKTRVKIGVLCTEAMQGKKKKEKRQAWRREVSLLLLLQLDRSLCGWDIKTSHCSDQELSMVPEGECLPRDLKTWLEDSELACTNTPNMESIPTPSNLAINSLLDKLSKVTNKNSEDGDQLQVDGEGPDENMDKDLGCNAKSTDPSSCSAEHNTTTVTAMEVCEYVDFGSKVERQNVHSSDKIEKKTKVEKKKYRIVDGEENETEVDEGQGHISVLTLCQNHIKVTTTFKQLMEVIKKINLMYTECAGCKSQSLATCQAKVKRLHKISEGFLKKRQKLKILNVMKQKSTEEHEKFWGSISALVTEYCHNKFAHLCQIQKLNDLVKQKKWTIDCGGVTILVKKKTRVKIGVLCVEVMKGGKRKKEKRQAWRREVSSLLLLQLDRSLCGWEMKTK